MGRLIFSPSKPAVTLSRAESCLLWRCTHKNVCLGLTHHSTSASLSGSDGPHASSQVTSELTWFGGPALGLQPLHLMHPSLHCTHSEGHCVPHPGMYVHLLSPLSPLTPSPASMCESLRCRNFYTHVSSRHTVSALQTQGEHVDLNIEFS